MMVPSYTYLQFEFEDNKSEPKKSADPILIKYLKDFLVLIIPIPAANPDFEERFDVVKVWMVECDAVSGEVAREVGLDKNMKTIVKMPYKGNYGYWSDSNMLLHDFKTSSFTYTEIHKDFFEQMWEEEANLQPDKKTYTQKVINVLKGILLVIFLPLTIFFAAASVLFFISSFLVTEKLIPLFKK